MHIRVSIAITSAPHNNSETDADYLCINTQGFTEGISTARYVHRWLPVKHGLLVTYPKTHTAKISYVFQVHMQGKGGNWVFFKLILKQKVASAMKIVV